jgi:phospholipid/cholesterol/gamma-HCH transport system substrate-binding protein
MRSRTVREGSVGLLLLLGVGCFGGLILWLGGLSLGRNYYEFVVNFQEAEGLEAGTEVRYRGVNVGKIKEINAGPNAVAVTVEVTPSDLVIPREGVLITSNQSGLIGDTYIDITSTIPVSLGSNLAKPLYKDCNSDLIICHKSKLQGETGVSFTRLIQSTIELTNVVNNPALFKNINTLVENSATATAGVSDLTKELASLSQSVRQELKGFSQNASVLTQKANQIGDSVDNVVNQVGSLTNQFSSSMNEFTLTANQVRLSAAQADRLIANVNGLVESNRSNLVTTLDNLNLTSQELRATVGGFGPILDQVKGAEFIRNLESLSANAAQASATFRTFSEGQTIKNIETATANAALASANLRQLSDPSNLVTLQQTLESARVVFQNAEKITSDLDELTGDPQFRVNIRRLVDGLSGLVSSTQQLQQQMQVAKSVAPLQLTVDNLAEDVVDEKREVVLKKEQMPKIDVVLPVKAAVNSSSQEGEE